MRSARPLRPTVILTCALLLVGTSTVIARAQESAPMVKSEVIRLLVDDSYTPEERTEIVRRNCMTFAPSESDLADFRRLGASPELLEVLRTCRTATSGETEVEVPTAPGDVSVPAPAVEEREIAMSWPDGAELPPLEPSAGAPAPPAPANVRESLFVQVEFPPRLQNPAEVQRTLREATPESVRQGNAGLRCIVWVFVDERGTVQMARIDRTSGSDAFDRAALEAARSMRFSPATGSGFPVATWVQQTLSVRR